MGDALHYRLDNIGFCSKLYRQRVGIPMGAIFAPLFANLRLFCYEGDLMLSLSVNNQAGVIKAFNIRLNGCAHLLWHNAVGDLMKPSQ